MTETLWCYSHNEKVNKVGACWEGALAGLTGASGCDDLRPVLLVLADAPSITVPERGVRATAAQFVLDAQQVPAGRYVLVPKEGNPS